MKAIRYSNRSGFVIALLAALIAAALFVRIVATVAVPMEITVCGSLILLVALAIIVSGLCNPVHYIFAYDTVKFGFMKNDELIIEGYFLDIEQVSRLHGMVGYRAAVRTPGSSGSEQSPFVVGTQDDLVIQLKGQRPTILPAGFRHVYKEFLKVYQTST